MKSNITIDDVKKAKLKAKEYLASRSETINNLREVDTMNELVNYGSLSLKLIANEETGKVFHLMNDNTLAKLLIAAKKDRTAWDILKAYTSKNPSDPRLSEFVFMLASEKPPAKKRGRQPEVIRDYFLLCALFLLINAGLSVPSNRVTRQKFNSAFVLEEILKEMNFKPILSPATIVDIYDRRLDVYQKAENAALVLK
ncbi:MULTISPECIES: hypothetical protein [unclassified Pseudoalteromonas]|jgi:hypothetical protein|uniref:hypothetical protein n=1 Tax=unclassified Pseudoalteromonas TaxID=194690 RepID=UPI00041CD463|nr:MULTISPECIES: hypothetical protein [unclassified Pseudoalteromonas]